VLAQDHGADHLKTFGDLFDALLRDFDRPFTMNDPFLVTGTYLDYADHDGYTNHPIDAIALNNDPTQDTNIYIRQADAQGKKT
jgi:hypothetical protein